MKNEENWRKNELNREMVKKSYENFVLFLAKMEIIKIIHKI